MYLSKNDQDWHFQRGITFSCNFYRCFVDIRPLSVSFLIRTSGKEYHSQADSTSG